MSESREEQVRSEASRGKNEPMAKSNKVHVEQNGEVRPKRAAAREQPGTDQNARKD
jgi:hypothetical protein